jgi:hypothetical protein
LIFEYYFVVAVGLMISSVTWDFYVIWLLPVFLAAFLAPGRALPAGWTKWLALGALAVALIALNFPGESALFEPNDVFYHPEWVPGHWVEEQVRLYHNHLDAVLYLRLGGLLLTAGTLAAVTLLRRRDEERRETPRVLDTLKA